ncbi:MAG: GNAT family N-acetyltransferase [Desulfobacterales bacterium]|nr:GNAT family N-acetyltransferase [Desulfobacterales bacterium]
MSENLTIRTKNIKEGDSNYCWVNIELGNQRVGKVRIRKIYSKVVIKNISIFPEFQGRGFGKEVVDLFKEKAREIVADRVRATARGFWERMGFSDTEDGNYTWRSDRR